MVKHLNALTEAGLLERLPAGRQVRYRVTPAPLSEAVSWMAEVGGQWDDRLAALARSLASRADRPNRARCVNLPFVHLRSGDGPDGRRRAASTATKAAAVAPAYIASIACEMSHRRPDGLANTCRHSALTMQTGARPPIGSREPAGKAHTFPDIFPPAHRR